MNIIEAVANNDINAVRRCIARNEDVNAKDKYGNTALIWASRDGHSDTAELLLRSGADVNVKDNYGNTALMSASCDGHSDIAELLLRSGADVNAKNKYGNTALIYASQDGHSDTAELLLRSGADVNAKNNNGDTALMWASRDGHSDIAELLLRSGADVNAKNRHGYTALILASRYGHTDIAERIVSVAMSDPCVPYTTVALSSFVPRCRCVIAQDYAGLVAKVIPLYTERAVKNATFGRDMQRDVEEILGGKTDEDRKLLTKKDTVLLTKLLKILRSIDYTELRVGQEGNGEASPAYDMEL